MDRTWQRQWDASRRQDNIHKILGVLKQSNLANGSDSIQSLTEMATKFEEAVFQSAESSEKYLSKIATKLAKVSAKMSVPGGQQQMVQNPPLHIPPGHMPVSQLGGGPQMLNQQSGQPGLRSSSPSLYSGSPGLPMGYSRGFSVQPNPGGSANTLPMGPAGGVPITALGMGGAPPGSFGLNPEQSRQENYNAYQQSVNRQQPQRQQLPPPQQVPANMTPQQMQAWVEMRNRELMQQRVMNAQAAQGGQQKANQQFQQQFALQGGGNPQMLTQQQQQQQQLYLQQQQVQHMKRQQQNQMQQGGQVPVPSTQARPGGPAAAAPGMDVEQLWQSLQQLKAKYLEPLTSVRGELNARLAAITGQGKAEQERSLKKLETFADRIITALQAADRNQAVAMQRNFSKGLGHFEQQMVQLLNTWQQMKARVGGVDPAKKAQQEHEALVQAQAAALKERQRKEQEILRIRQQQQQEQLLKQQAQQQAQAQQRAQQSALKQAQQTAAQQPLPQQGAVAVAKATQSKLLDQVLSAFAVRANMSVPELLAKVQQSKELKERVSFEVKKLQARMAQQASAGSLPPPTPPQPSAPAPPLKFDSFSPSPMPAQTPPLSQPTPPETFRAPSPVEAYKPFSPDNFKAPTPPFQSALPAAAPGRQLSASGGSVLTSPGGSVAWPTSPRFTGSEGKPPLPGGPKLTNQGSSKGAAPPPPTAEVDVEDLPIAALRSQVSSPPAASVKDNPLKALAKKVWLLSQSSQSRSTLDQAASDIDQLVQLTNQYALVPRGTDSKSAKPENLVANTRARLAAKPGGMGGAKRARGKQSVVSIGVDGSDFDAGSSVSDAHSCVDFEHSGDEAGSNGGKRARFGAQSALEGEIEDVNRFLIDTRVEISLDGTREAQAEGRKGTAVLCTYNGGGVSPCALRLLVPPSYPTMSPSVWHDYSAPGFSLPFATAARENFSAAVRRLVGGAVSVGAMARCWDQSVREAIADVALSQGGGCFSNTVGVWMHCA